jgi:hypothetical protein
MIFENNFIILHLDIGAILSLVLPCKQIGDKDNGNEDSDERNNVA